MYATKSANEAERRNISCTVAEAEAAPDTMQWYKDGGVVNDTSHITTSEYYFLLQIVPGGQNTEG